MAKKNRLTTPAPEKKLKSIVNIQRGKRQVEVILTAQDAKKLYRALADQRLNYIIILTFSDVEIRLLGPAAT